MPSSASAAARAVRDVVERIDIEALTAQVAADLRDEPAYRRFVRDEDLQDRGPAVIRWNLELFGRWLADGRPPDVDELGRIGALVRIRAEEGMPLEEGLRVYRRGARLGWETVLRMAGPDERQALLEGSAVYLDYVELVADAFLAAYADAEQGRDPGEAKARALLQRLRRGVPGTHERAAAEALGVDLDAPLRPFAAAVPDMSVSAHVALAAGLRDAGALAAVETGGVVGLIPGGSASAGPGVGGAPAGLGGGAPTALIGGTDGSVPDAHDPAFAALVERLAPAAVLAVEAPASWPRLEAALDELLTVVSFGLAAGRVGPVSGDEFLVDLLLGQAPRVATRLASRVLGGLDPEQVATLRALVERDFDRSAAARALPVHRNTLMQRVQRIETVTGLDLRRTQDQVLVTLALRVDG